MNVRGGTLILGLVISLLLLGDSRSFSQEVEVPQEVQVPFLLKILTYDRALDDKAKELLNIGVLYNPESQASLKDRDEILKAFEQFRDKTVKGLSVEILPFVFSTFEDYFDLPGSDKVHVLIILTGNAERIREIVDLTRRRKILSFSTSPELVKKGVSLGIDLVEDKMKIVVNYEATKKEGADLSANLLKICQIIRE